MNYVQLFTASDINIARGRFAARGGRPRHFGKTSRIQILIRLIN